MNKIFQIKNKTILNYVTCKYFGIKYHVKPFSDKTMNIIINKEGVGSRGALEYISKLSELTHNKLRLEIEVVDNVTSPTFALLNEYYTKKNELICHYDFYRIEEESEIYRIGFYDYLDSAEKIFVEWPEKAESVLPENRVNVTIKTDGEKRIVIVEENK